MKRSEMIQDIASELIHEYTNFISYDKAQELAEIILSRCENEGMLPPGYLKPTNSPLVPGSFKRKDGQWCDITNEWEQE